MRGVLQGLGVYRFQLQPRIFEEVRMESHGEEPVAIQQLYATVLCIYRAHQVQSRGREVAFIRLIGIIHALIVPTYVFLHSLHAYNKYMYCSSGS